MNRLIRPSIGLIPFGLLCAIWEIMARGNKATEFLFSRPSLVAASLGRELVHGDLAAQTSITASEAAMGFFFGTIAGTVIGLVCSASPLTTRLVQPSLKVFGVIPVYALAPMTVIWFGIGFWSKVCIAALSTVFVAAGQAAAGASNPDRSAMLLFQSFRATRWQTMLKLRLPSAAAWVFSSCRLNIGFALLGAFVGEVISSERGLGHYIMKASGLYDVTRVLTGVACMVGVALFFDSLLRLLASIPGARPFLVPPGSSLEAP